MLPIPAHILRADIATPQLRFLWDEWNVVDTYEPMDEDEGRRLAVLSRRANCAFTIAIAEWIVHRFDGMDADPEPLQFIEAVADAAGLEKPRAIFCQLDQMTQDGHERLPSRPR